MRRLAAAFPAVILPAGVALAGDLAVIEGRGIHVPGSDTNPCPPSALSQHHDGSTESAFTWEGAGIQEPDYGALAEGYPAAATGVVCGIELFLTRWGIMTGQGAIDLYVWNYDVATGNPGAVLAVAANTPISGVSRWPGVSTHDLDVPDAEAPAHGLFVGYWPRSFLEAPSQFGGAMDTDGFGGCPRTNIAPGLGYPTGWAHPSSMGYEMEAWGIGAWIQPGPTPSEATSWGRVKNLYSESSP